MAQLWRDAPLGSSISTVGPATGETSFTESLFSVACITNRTVLQDRIPVRLLCERPTRSARGLVTVEQALHVVVGQVTEDRA